MNVSSPNKILSGQKEIASYLGISVKSLRRYLKSIPFSQLGKQIMIFETDLADWVRRNFNKRIPKNGHRISHLPKDYQKLLFEIKDRIRSAQQEALRMVNEELTALYWEIGQIIITQKRNNSQSKRL